MELELKLESELGAMVAITVVVLSVFMAVTKLKDENVVQAMQHTQVAAVDSWNEYQAERIKLHIDENDAAAIKLRADANAPAVSTEQKRLAGRLDHYTKASDALAKDAKAGEARYASLEFRHDQFDIADALCSIALAMSAVAALAARRVLLFVGWGAGAFGVLMGVAGMAGWNIHPEWLAALFG
jgi:phage host-nuclease inhibitor protein Gam